MININNFILSLFRNFDINKVQKILRKLARKKLILVCDCYTYFHPLTIIVIRLSSSDNITEYLITYSYKAYYMKKTDRAFIQMHKIKTSDDIIEISNDGICKGTTKFYIRSDRINKFLKILKKYKNEDLENMLALDLLGG